MRHCWACYLQTKKTCFVISSSVTALAAVITLLLDTGIWLSMLKLSTKGKVLDFRRAKFSLHRGQLRGNPREASMDKKGTKIECFKHVFLEIQNYFIPFKGKESWQSKRFPLALWTSESASKEKCTRDGKVDEQPLRNTRALPGCAQMKFKKQKLRLSWNWREMSKNTRKGSSGT